MTNSNIETDSVSRRDFMRTAALAAAAVTELSLASQTLAADDTQPAVASSDKPLIGFQAEVSYLLSYGIAAFLDDVQTRANVNAVFLHSNLFAPSKGGPNGPGSFAAAHPEYYQDVKMKPQPLGPGDFNLPDAMEQITAETKKRGVKIYSWMEEDNRARPNINGMDELYEIDLHGRRTAAHPGGPCLNNPYFRNLIAGQVEDYLRTYDVDGLQRGSERQGPLGNALGAWHHGAAPKNLPGQTSCFCEYCQAKAAKVGIDFDKVKAAFLALEPFVTNGRAGRRPLDGYNVEFWRLLLKHPELLAWENFWADSMREMQREFYAKAKSIKPTVQIGFHIWHNIAFNPMYRAEQEYKPYTEYSDFLKPVIYDNCAAERMASFVDSIGQTIYGDMGKEQLLQMEYSVMDFKEKTYAQIHAGRDGERFSADYVYKETKRAVDGVAGSKTRICPGLGIDVQIQNSTPQSVADAVRAIFRAGGKGMVISTSHAAMKPENLSAAGATLRELKVV
ncbi:MAG: twin-arginine translocation signal domain-containing protein [Tepidisphaeraceae bacterium]|jgi:hypothetical protein